MTIRHSTLDADLGNPEAPAGSKDWTTYFVRQAQKAWKDIDSEVHGLQRLLAKLDKHGAWKTLGYISFDTFCFAELKIDPQTLAAIREAPSNAIVGQVVEKAQDLKQGARTDLSDEPVYNIHKLAKGTSRARLAARLKKHEDPELHRRIAAGEFKSVYAAAKAAGLITEKPLTQLKYWWKKASLAEREEFKKEIL